MKLSVDVIKDLDQYYVVDVHVASRYVQKTIDTLKLLGIPAVNKAGGFGWELADGYITIRGTKRAVQEAIQHIEHAITGPRFVNGLEVKARHERGALP